MKIYLRKKWLKWRGTILLITFVILPIRSSIASLNFVPTGSMNPTILEGDFVFSNLLSYDLRIPMTDIRMAKWGDPDRGDIVICFSPDDDTRLVKRVVGIPGDRIEMRNSRLLINGKVLEYGPLDSGVSDGVQAAFRDQAIFATEKLPGRDHAVMGLPRVNSPHRDFSARILGEDEYFVMGDNRDNSRDSRIFGIMPRAKIVGEAKRVIMSFDKPDVFQPRWERFFMPLR